MWFFFRLPRSYTTSCLLALFWHFQWILEYRNMRQCASYRSPPLLQERQQLCFLLSLLSNNELIHTHAEVHTQPHTPHKLNAAVSALRSVYKFVVVCRWKVSWSLYEWSQWGLQKGNSKRAVSKNLAFEAEEHGKQKDTSKHICKRRCSAALTKVPNMSSLAKHPKSCHAIIFKELPEVVFFSSPFVTTEELN